MSFGRDDRRLRELEQANASLRDEVDRYREAEERRRSQEERARRERRDALRRAQCEAGTWEEAFRKGIHRAHKEARQEEHDIALYGEEAGAPWFGPWSESLERALGIYSHEMDRSRQEALARIARRVEMELPDGVAKEELAEALRADDCSYLVKW